MSVAERLSQGYRHIQGLIFGTTRIPLWWNLVTIALKSGYLFLFIPKTYRLPSSPTVYPEDKCIPEQGISYLAHSSGQFSSSS